MEYYSVALVVKSPPANVGDIRHVGLIPRSGRSPGGKHGDSLQYFAWRLQSIGLQRVGHD